MLPTERTTKTESLDLVIYSDGSLSGQGAGYGYVVYYGKIRVAQGHGAAGTRTEVHDAEIMGAVEGLKAALAADCAAYATGITVLLDNLAAASLLADGRPAPHRRELTGSFKQLSLQWSSTKGLLPRTPVRVRWVPGHSGIAGNEEADELAKRGATLNGAHIPP